MDENPYKFERNRRRSFRPEWLFVGVLFGAVCALGILPFVMSWLPSIVFLVGGLVLGLVLARL